MTATGVRRRRMNMKEGEMTLIQVVEDLEWLSEYYAQYEDNQMLSDVCDRFAKVLEYFA